MDNNSDEHFIITKATIEANMQSTIESNMQDTDKKLTKITEDIVMLTSNITSMMDHTNN